MRNLDFSSWNGAFTTVIGLVLVSVVAVGIRLLLMQTIQRRRERENRQINERLRTLISAYKTLGGSFTGDLSVDPTHLGTLRRLNITETQRVEPVGTGTVLVPPTELASSERSRRIRDAVEAALSDVILLGTDEQVNLAANAAREMVAGNKVHLSELIISLRNFIRSALDLDPIPLDLQIPRQGPLRPSMPGGKVNGTTSQGRNEDADKGNARSGNELAMGAIGLGSIGIADNLGAQNEISDEYLTDKLHH